MEATSACAMEYPLDGMEPTGCLLFTVPASNVSRLVDRVTRRVCRAAESALDFGVWGHTAATDARDSGGHQERGACITVARVVSKRHPLVDRFIGSRVVCLACRERTTATVWPLRRLLDRADVHRGTWFSRSARRHMARPALA